MQVTEKINANHQLSGVFSRHRGPVTCVAGISGRNAAISVGYDSAVAYVDLDKNTVALMGYHDHLVNAVSVNPEGTKAATSSSDYTICIWDIETRKPEMILRGHHDDVNGFAFINEKLGVSVSHDHKLYVWNLETGAVKQILEGHFKYVMSVDYGNGCIYSSGDDMTLRQWDPETGKELRCWGPFEVEVDSCAVGSLHNRVILGGDDGALRIFDSETGELIKLLQGHDSGIKKVAVSPKNGDMVSAGYDQRLRVWDGETFELKADLECSPIVWERSLNWSPCGTQVLGGTFDGTVLVWRPAEGTGFSEIGGDIAPGGNICINDISGTTDGRIAMVSDDGHIRVGTLRPDKASLDHEVEPASGRVLMNGVTLDETSGLVVGGAHNQKLYCVHPHDDGYETGQEIDGKHGPINCVRVSNHPEFDGDIFAATYNGVVVHTNAAGEAKGEMPFHNGAIKALRLHPTKAVGVSTSSDGDVLSWTFAGEMLRRFPGHVAIGDDIDMDPSGDRFVTVSRDFTLNVYDLESGHLVFARFLGKKSPKSVNFWDKNTVIVGNYWGWLLRFNLEDGTMTRARIASNGISAMTRVGDYLAAASYDGTVYLVNANTLEVVNHLTLMVQRTTEETATTMLGQHSVYDL